MPKETIDSYGDDQRIEVSWGRGSQQVMVSVTSDDAGSAVEADIAAGREFRGFGCVCNAAYLDHLISVLKRARRQAFDEADRAPHVGALVLYTLGEGDAADINRRRADAGAHGRKHPAHTAEAGEPGRTGHVAHVGNGAQAGQVYPALVVRDWEEPSGTVNLQVMLDGNDVYWATSRTPGEGPGAWRWPGP